MPDGFPGDLVAGLNDLKVFAGADPLEALSQAYAIVRNGTEVRITGQSGETNHAFFWDPNLTPNLRLTDIGDLADGSVDSTGWGITGSDPYYVVGGSTIFGLGCYRGFVWDSASANMTQLTTPTGFRSEAFDIREQLGATLIGGWIDDGAICPNVCVECAPQYPFNVSDAVAWVNLTASTLNQPPPLNNIEGEARDLNDAGNLVGWGTDPTNDCRNRPLYWEDTMAVGIILETVPTGQQGRALGINSNKDVVGANIDLVVAVLWDSTVPGTWIYSDLNDLIIPIDHDWELVEARAINDNGWIVGWGDHDGAHRAFLLRPITTCLHDLDGDGAVSTADLLILLASWGPCPDAGQTGKFCDADYDFDGSVLTSDLLELLANWGPCFIGAEIPQTVQDCLNRYCCAPEDLLALEKCLCIVDPECDPSQ
ncbi:MAG: hypothetical protein IH984_07545 [Planctomycetes bacterium]|nr:hypothetical protein [Planctomycetota bacterium]